MKRTGYHLLGIGGIGMSALAHLLLDRGCPVSGLDQRESAATQDLRARGAAIVIGDDASFAPEKTLVYSTAIAPGHPSRQRAKKEGRTLLHRAELLAQLFGSQTPLLIAGSHGKTSTTALLIHTLRMGGLAPSFVLGGNSFSLQRPGQHGTGDLFIAEADESDGSFLSYRPFGAVVTNIDNDHFDYWKTEKRLREGFQTFIRQIDAPKWCFWCIDDPQLKALDPPGVSYGVSSKAEVQLRMVEQRARMLTFTVLAPKYPATSFVLPLMGKHQALNALPVIGLARKLQMSDQAIQRAFSSFRGVARRLEKKGEARGIIIYDDYAHHPTAVEKVVATLKESYPSKRLIALWEPHRFSRVQQLGSAFIAALKQADVVLITDVYSAGESPCLEATGENLQSAFCRAGQKERVYVPKERLVSFLVARLRSGDCVVTLGAGGITRVSDELLLRLT